VGELEGGGISILERLNCSKLKKAKKIDLEKGQGSIPRFARKVKILTGGNDRRNLIKPVLPKKGSYLEKDDGKDLYLKKKIIGKTSEIIEESGKEKAIP